MGQSLKPGDRVHITSRNRMAGYQAGDRGTITRASTSAANGRHYYTVAMDKDDPTHTGAVFTEGEIDAVPDN